MAGLPYPIEIDADFDVNPTLTLWLFQESMRHRANIKEPGLTPANSDAAVSPDLHVLRARPLKTYETKAVGQAEEARILALGGFASLDEGNTLWIFELRG